MTPSDRELMDGACAGDRDAFGLLFERHAAALWRTAFLMLHDSAAADDAVQETFTRGLAGLVTYRADAPPRTWLYAIALNVCRRARVVGSRQPAAVDPAALEDVRAPRGVLTSVVRRERSRRLAVVLGYLSPRQREAFVLHYIEGFPFEQVGGLMGVTEDAARQLAQRARETLRGELAAYAEPVKS